MLKIDNVTMKFGGITAINGLTMQARSGEVTGLIGPNGAGKTTVFNVVTGVYAPTAGKVLFGEGEAAVDITGQQPHVLARKGISRTFQNIRLFKSMSVFENVFVGNHLKLKSNLISATFRFPDYVHEEQKIIEKTEYLLEKVGLIDERNEISSSLPYGKQRRLEIARALATDPKLLLLDEPAAGMNPQESFELVDFIREIKREFNLTVLLIEHHMDVVMNISDSVYVLDHGALISSGTPEQVQSDQHVIDAYLGV